MAPGAALGIAALTLTLACGAVSRRSDPDPSPGVGAAVQGSTAGHGGAQASSSVGGAVIANMGSGGAQEVGTFGDYVDSEGRCRTEEVPGPGCPGT